MAKPYGLTAIAGTHINGVRVRDPEIDSGKKPIYLTDLEAETELRNGTIAPWQEKKPAEKADKKD